MLRYPNFGRVCPVDVRVAPRKSLDSAQNIKCIVSKILEGDVALEREKKGGEGDADTCFPLVGVSFPRTGPIPPEPELDNLEKLCASSNLTVVIFGRPTQRNDTTRSVHEILISVQNRLFELRIRNSALKIGYGAVRLLQWLEFWF